MAVENKDTCKFGKPAAIANAVQRLTPATAKADNQGLVITPAKAVTCGRFKPGETRANWYRLTRPQPGERYPSGRRKPKSILSDADVERIRRSIWERK